MFYVKNRDLPAICLWTDSSSSSGETGTMIACRAFWNMGCGSPRTATSLTSGCRKIIPSTSQGDTAKYFVLMKSLSRSTRNTKPSSSTTQMSPVLSQFPWAKHFCRNTKNFSSRQITWHGEATSSFREILSQYSYSTARLGSLGIFVVSDHLRCKLNQKFASLSPRQVF